ncbi:hypothetical protein [Marinicella meishanensis]|uniref:hypothetical protein n=1 Tax=Marinicella meishanensis TaxID=2873263 RepID=UPI001CC123C5|nr:hypothetical protein [Marinicella sp. NBU2979]
MTGENNSTNVDVVDASNLTFTVVDSMTATSDFGDIKGIFGMSLHPITQEMYVVYQPNPGGASGRRLGIMDQTTAAITDIGNCGNIIDIAFASDGNLYGTTGTQSTNYSFVFIDTATAFQTLIFDHAIQTYGGGMAFNPHTGEIYYQNNNGTSFIDPGTFVETLGSPVGSPGETQAMIILTPTLGWMAFFGTLYSFNPVTEVFSNTGTTINAYHAMAFQATPMVGGMVSGLELGNALVLQNNGGDDLLVNSDGAFVFSEALNVGDDYEVSVLTQTGDPTQPCMVSQGQGTANNQDITNVLVSCEPSDLIFRNGFD